MSTLLLMQVKLDEETKRASGGIAPLSPCKGQIMAETSTRGLWVICGLCDLRL